MTPPPPRHFQYPVPPPCAYMESRARAYTTAQTATANANGNIKPPNEAKTSANTQAAQQLNRKRKHRLKRLSRRRRLGSHQRQHQHTKKHTHCTITTQKAGDCRENIQKRKNVYKTSEKKLANALRKWYYKLASNEGGSLRTGRSPHNRQ